MNAFWEIFPSVLELFLNMLEFIALVVSVSTFLVLMVNKFSKALKQILEPYGLSIRLRIKVMFVCRKTPLQRRAFIEFAILKTQGYPVSRETWKAIINEFKVFYAESHPNLVYTIPNCTALIGEDFSVIVKKYFDYFEDKQVKRIFGISDTDSSWVIKIRMEEAYITPTCLLGGLLSKYEENWSEFIKRYVSTAYISEADDNRNRILSEELYFTFAWLLWGPSYEIDYRNFWAGLLQVSYGDESNSVPAVADANSNMIKALKQKFDENNGRRYGALVSATFSVYENKEFYRNLQSNVNLSNSYFYDKVENGEFAFALQFEDYVPYDNYKAHKYYCTAYVWLLFEVEDENVYGFRPERSVAFFEHANLADIHTYQFLISTLVDKCIKHFRNVFANNDLGERRYRYVCAMNNEIQKAFVERYNEIIAQNNEMGEWFRTRLIIESKYNPSIVFAAYDQYFMPNEGVVYQEVSLKDKESIVNLGRFYTEIYIDNFPDENERETFDSILGYLKQAEENEEYRYHIILALNNQGDLVGGTIFDYFANVNAGVIEFLAVRTDLQSGGIGTMIYNHILSVLSADAFKFNKKKLEHVFCEIDSPEYSKANVKKYLYFWNKLKFKRILFDYVQPSLSQMQEKVDGLWLTVANLNDTLNTMPGEYVLKVIYEYMRFSMRIKKPNLNADYCKMKTQIEDANIKLKRIV